MTPEAKKDVVAIHNKLRQSLVKGQVKGQPKAKNMLNMVRKIKTYFIEYIFLYIILLCSVLFLMLRY
jgi:hypothetical protein